MVRHGWICSLAALVSIVVATGCDTGKTEKSAERGRSEATSSAKATSVKPDVVQPTANPKLATGEPNAGSAIHGPDAVVRAVFDGLNEQNPKAVWDFLPAGYQRDVNELVHEAAKNVDAQSWELLFHVVDDAIHLLRAKKDFILSYPRLKQNPQVNLAELEKNWDATVNILATLNESELSDVSKLQKLDVGRFLETTGKQAMTQLAAISKSLPDDPFSRQFGRSLKETKVELIEIKGETAIVRLTPADAKTPATEVPFVQVEGKWIPRSLAEGWKPGIEQARQQISTLGRDKPSKQDQPNKQDQPAELMLSQLAAAIAELQAIESADEFHQRLDEELPRLAMLLEPRVTGKATTGDAVAPSSASRDAGVTITIHTTLDEQAEDTLCNQLNAIADHPDLAVTESPSFARGQTSIRIWPVADVAAFAKRIDFARVVKVDSESRTIVIELPEKK